jgi:hypothetical protein
MKQAHAPAKFFERNRSCLRYDGKTVEFLYDLGGKLLLLTGRFVADLTSDLRSLDIHYNGRLDPHDPPFSDYCFHLSEAHLRSTVPATKPGSQVDFLMETPLPARACIRM